MLKSISLTCFLLAAGLKPVAATEFSAGPLFDDFPLTLSTGHRTEALGPFFYFDDQGEQTTWAIPPLFSRSRDQGTDSEGWDFLYPVATYDRFGSESRWHVLQLLSFARGNNQQEQQARRFTLYPLYFQQRSEDASQNYTAVVPFYGHLQNRLMLRDEAFFVMFPIYAKTRKKDVVTENYLYPFFHLRHGNGLQGWQFWPLLGHEHKEVTTLTNGFGDTQAVPGHDSWFALWPFYLNHNSGIGTDNPQHLNASLPLYSVLRSPQRDSTTVIWPFFNHITDREKKYTEWDAPWPLIEFASGSKTTTRVWPFFSHAQTTNQESRFYIWPVYKYNRVHGDILDRERTRILFFLYSDTIVKNLGTGTAQRKRDFWPLYTQRDEHNGNSRLQILALLEPFLPSSAGVERNYSPLWSIWRAEKNPRAGVASQSLLWNLYRRETGPESKKCSLLFGLFQYQSGSNGNRLSLFYIPVVKTKPTAPSAAR